jgi:hypothetical protein
MSVSGVQGAMGWGRGTCLTGIANLTMQREGGGWVMGLPQAPPPRLPNQACERAA